MRTSGISALRPKYMIDHTSLFRLLWDLLIVAMNIINIFFIPLEVSFSPEYANSGGYMAFDYLFDLCFIIDIVFNFRTSFNDEHGDKIYDKNIIAKRYVKTVAFYCDVVAVI